MISKNFKNRIITSFFLLLLIYLIFINNFILVYSLLIFSLFSFFEFTNLLKKIYKNKLFFYLFINFFLLYLSIFSFFIFILMNFYQSKILIFLTLVGCIASDAGGYFIGKTLKGPKLTKISPNKTISGAIGSIIFTILSISFISNIFFKNFSLKILIISVVISLSCQIGDLFFSLIKRKAKLKDTGNFLPGHGGVLDRLDGILIGVPVGLIIFLILY